MKRIIFIATVILVFALMLVGCGGSTPVSDFEYKYDAALKGIIITKYNGTSIKVQIPKTIEGEPVTGISGEAIEAEIGGFAESGIAEIVIPDSVTSIGDGAFYKCEGLTTITLPDGVASIGESAFAGCIGLTNLVIPDGVTSIGYAAFRDCSRLTNVTIPNGMTDIGDSAFSGCTGLINVTIPDSVTSISRGAFSSCIGLTNITIPNSVVSIGIDGPPFGYYYSNGVGTFSGCTGLKNITLPDGVEKIGNDCFQGCEAISVTHRGITYDYSNIDELFYLLSPSMLR